MPLPQQIQIKVANIPFSGELQSHVRWSQYFVIRGAEGIAKSAQDVSLYEDYNDFVPQRLMAKSQWLAWDPNSPAPGLWLPDVYNYFSWQLTAADAQEIHVLGATTDFKLAITGADGSGWLYDPIFYFDDKHCFVIVPTSVDPPPTTISRSILAKLPAPDSTAQIAKIWSHAAVTNVDLSIQTPTNTNPASGPPSPYLMTLIAPVTSLTRPSTHTAFRFEAFDHPYVTDALRNLNRDGLDGLYDPQPGKPGADIRRQLKSEDYFLANYVPMKWVDTPFPLNDFDFTPEGAYSVYNWELFFHIPFLIATKLADNQQFDDALAWFHYIFNPTEPLAPGSTETAPQRFWKVKPFYQLSGADTDAESPVAILSLLLSHDDTDPARLAARKRLQNQVEQWRENPFDPDVIARLRPVAYMKAVVIKYLDMLIAWGDQLFSQATRESINEAVQIYVMALRVLGKRPVKLPPVKTAPLTYDDLASSVDDFSDAVANIETVLPPVNDEIQFGDADDSPVDARSMYFCVPPNDKLLGYWDTVSDRLTKIRNCLSITGQPLSLPLFAPPIDPGVLIAARAAGVDIGSVAADVSSPPPIHRYTVLAQRATELVSEVKAFGSLLLSVLEKKDAEALALLRGNQEVQLLSTQRVVKQWALQDAQDALAAAVAANDAANKRVRYYTSRTFTNTSEKLQLSSIGNASDARLVAGVAQAIGAAVAEIPDFTVGLSGWAGSPVSTFRLGGGIFVRAASAIATVSGIAASYNDTQGQSAGLTGAWQRRQDDWRFQADLARSDVAQTAAQIAAANDRINQAQADLDAHDQQYQNAIDARDFMRDKFTNEELYDWMSSQLLALYFQMYSLAYDAAKRAERAWQFELADDVTTFITFGYWESARQGLLAGERLSLDIKRMEMAYLDKDVREFELTRHIPLTMLDPYAMQQLRETGTCQISIPEAFFDADSPGHYLRRIKSVSLSLVGATGPYTPVRCTLTLLSSQVRTSPAVTGTPAVPDPNMLIPSTAAVQSIVTSTGRDDAGLFETNLRDERYLPFERAGAVSNWQLDLPAPTTAAPVDLPLFDYRTISEVVIHMRYTARDGGAALRNAVCANTTGELATQQWNIGFSVKSAFSDAWYEFLSAGSFLPTQLTGLVSWFRADLGVTVVGSAVTAWNDQVSGGFNMGGGVSPTFVPSSDLGGEPAIQFDGATQYLTNAGTPAAHTECDIFVVYKSAAGQSAVYSNTGFTTPSGGTDILVGESSTGGVGRAVASGLSTPSISGGGGFGTVMIAEVSFQQSSGLYTLWVNGTQTASGNFTPGSSTANVNLGPANLGFDTTSSAYFNGVVGEIIVFNRRLSDTERGQVTTYLQARYTQGIALPLDTDHVPFRSANAEIDKLTFIRVQKTIAGPSFTAQLTGPSVSGTPVSFAGASALNGQYVGVADYTGTAKSLGAWNFVTDPANFTADDDLWVIVTYTAAS